MVIIYVCIYNHVLRKCRPHWRHMIYESSSCRCVSSESVNVISKTNRRGDRHEDSIIVYRQLLETVGRAAEFNSSDGTSWRWRRWAPKRVGVLVKQRELVYDRRCIRCWCNKGKINKASFVCVWPEDSGWPVALTASHLATSYVLS
jgi:hypothetical protein